MNRALLPLVRFHRFIASSNQLSDITIDDSTTIINGLQMTESAQDTKNKNNYKIISIILSNLCPRNEINIQMHILPGK